MGFEEELLASLRKDAESRRQSFIKKYGIPSEMSPSDRRFYDLNYADAEQKSLSMSFDKINCGGYAFEINTFLSPDTDYDYNAYHFIKINNDGLVTEKIRRNY